MLKKIVDKLAFRSLNSPINIFFDKEYTHDKDYLLRGQAWSIQDIVYKNTEEYAFEYGIGYCVLFLYFMKKNSVKVNGSTHYDIRFSTGLGCDQYGFVYGATEDEYEEIRALWRKEDSANKEYNNPISLNYSGKYGMRFPNGFIERQIEREKKVILFNIDIEYCEQSSYMVKQKIGNSAKTLRNYLPSEELSRNLKKKIPEKYKKVYSLLARNFSDASCNRGISPRASVTTLNNVYRSVILNHKFDAISEDDYIMLLKTIGNFAHEWSEINENEIEQGKRDNFIERLRDFIKNNQCPRKHKESMKDYKERKDKFYSPLREFCLKFFDEIVQELKYRHWIRKCKYCGNILDTVRRRKYCSNEYDDGSDCHYSYLLRDYRH